MGYLELPNPKLFVGLPFSGEVALFLEKLPPEIYALYFHSYESYLHVQSVDGRSYIGKEAPHPISLEQLSQLKENIFSILKKVIPDYSVSHQSLKLIGFLD